MKKFVIVAGEASGDILGASLIQHLKLLYPDAMFVGIGGPLMIKEGLTSLYPMDRLSVMGLVEVLGRLKELLGIRKHIFNHCIELRPDAFIGIDSPDFNIPLERRLKERNIKTVHYVSPSVWAWRQKRIFKIKKSIDLMLALFPFEMEIYKQHDIPVSCVGHTLADEIPLHSDKGKARVELGVNLENDAPVFAILPGSRRGEVARLAPLFVQTMKHIKQSCPNAQFILPAANKDRRDQIEEVLCQADMEAYIIDGQSRTVMAASDAILLASGTAALEAMLVKRPMVVAYRFTKLTYAIMSRMLKVPYVSLPNLLANKMLVPELIQDDATPENLAKNVVETWKHFSEDGSVVATYTDLHKSLKLNAGETAAAAVQHLITQN
ncbi:lipid-A-disaccharide synthase [Marinomonas balearica]|uniref:Lipid-A-disaccharide synthase n=1 Tax=Marinomonas balearica TaxID=491947 RepID=A0A4R6M4Z4_9GAMM|nr:lipid-A-disaccharide synthase [Marinomonas balearica]TDO96398.1 lipid-A-disaccharide synthase [Marinomonas balearica]